MNNKQRRRKERRDNNRRKQENHIKKEMERGRTMWENNNGQDFSLSWINLQLPKLIEGLHKGVEEGEKYLTVWIQTYRILIRDIILRWPSCHPYSPEYELLKSVLEIYWDLPSPLCKVNLIKTLLEKYHRAKTKDNSTSDQKS